mmetsp:Transcript_23324/g.56157  ORF Transcript_23324/g.56157 Transcript_23324/m.56157 type:complete len:216 (+) Transcript_23324:1517-2164(+)
MRLALADVRIALSASIDHLDLDVAKYLIRRQLRGECEHPARHAARSSIDRPAYTRPVCRCTADVEELGVQPPHLPDYLDACAVCRRAQSRASGEPEADADVKCRVHEHFRGRRALRWVRGEHGREKRAHVVVRASQLEEAVPIGGELRRRLLGGVSAANSPDERAQRPDVRGDGGAGGLHSAGSRLGRRRQGCPRVRCTRAQRCAHVSERSADAA